MADKPTTPRKLSPTQDLFCGAVAGLCARMTVAPLDVVKIRFQVQSETAGRYHYTSVVSAIRSILASEGPTAFWKGNVPALLMVTPYAALQFASFYQLKDFAQPLGEPFASLSLGAISASFATICTYPLDLLRTRLAAQPEPKTYHGLRHAAALITRTHGPTGLYAGLRPTLIEIIPYISLHFALYENLKTITLRRRRLDKLSSVDSLVIGAASGTLSKLVTLPLDNAKKVMQVQTQFAPSTFQNNNTIANVLSRLWRTGGLRACFRGATPSLLKAAPNSAITFAVYERTKRMLSAR